MRPGVMVFGAALFACVVCSAASAQAATVTIDTRSPALEEDDGGGWTASLGFTNLTGVALPLTAKASDAADAGCSLTLDKQELPPAEHTAVTVTVPAGCDVGDDGIDFEVTGGTSIFLVTAAPKPDPSTPDWGAFWAFPFVLFLLLVAAGLFLVFRSDRPPPNTPLKYLEAAWSFKDSWVSNVTLAGGLLAGIFGSSELLTSLLGEEAESSVAMATVGAAVALAFTGAGAIVLFATKSKDGDFFTIGGLLAASALTLAGAYGQLWVLYEAGRRLDLSDWVDRGLWLFAGALAILLAVYAVRSLVATLKQGLEIPEPGPASDTIVAARMIVEALKAHPDIDGPALDLAIEDVIEDYPTVGTSPGDDYAPQRRSAML